MTSSKSTPMSRTDRAHGASLRPGPSRREHIQPALGFARDAAARLGFEDPR
jgi:hypothetical protein